MVRQTTTLPVRNIKADRPRPVTTKLSRPSKSLDVDQAAQLVAAALADETVMRAYVIVSLLTGARTEELRALTWSHVDLDGDPPTVSLWRSVRAGGDTKTKKSRRTLSCPVGVSTCCGFTASPSCRAA